MSGMGGQIGRSGKEELKRVAVAAVLFAGSGTCRVRPSASAEAEEVSLYDVDWLRPAYLNRASLPGAGNRSGSRP